MRNAQNECAFKIELRADADSGRAQIILVESSFYSALAHELFAVLSERTRTLLLELSALDSFNWRTATTALSDKLNEVKLRQATFIALGPAGAILQNLCLSEPKLVRSAVFVDASTRPHPSAWLKLLDRLERGLPMGLPFRAASPSLDARSLLQRIRCPSLVLSTAQADAYLREQAKVMSANLPTSWYFDLSEKNAADQIRDVVLAFEQVPAKCPQKNL